MIAHLPYREKIIEAQIIGTEMTRTSFIVCAVEDVGKMNMAMLYYAGHENLDDAQKEYDSLMKQPLILPMDGGGFKQLLWVIVKATVKIERVME